LALFDERAGERVVGTGERGGICPDFQVHSEVLERAIVELKEWALNDDIFDKFG
jgi:hypothetical protein